MSDEPGKESSLFDNDEQNMSIVDDEAFNVPGYDPSLDLEPSQVRKALLKVDFLILPPIVLCFCFLQFDRTNIGNALTDSLRHDIAVGNTQVNLAQTLFTVGFIVSELPFNVVSKRIGPERLLPMTMCLWGIVTWSQVFIKNARGLYACRFLVGTLEGGYIPGFALYISKFYANHELGLRYAIFWAANSFAGALSGPLSIGLLSLGGRGGLKGWQWLFLVEGSVTCLLAVGAYVYFPHNAAKPKTIFGKSFSLFNQREASIIVTRVIANDPSKALQYGKPVLPLHIWDTFGDWRLYGHLIAALLSMVMIAPMNTYAPSMIKSMGFSSLQANGLNSVGSICALVWSVSLAFSSDRFQERGFHIAAGYLFGVVGLLWLALAPETVGKWVLYGGVVWTQMGMGSAQAISAAWLTTKMEDHKRPVALAAYVMCIQLANFPGNQLFRTQVGALLERLDASAQSQTGPEEQRQSKGIIQPGNKERSAELDPAPVLLIRKAVTDAGVSPRGQFDLSNDLADVISAGLVTAPAAYSLLELFRLHYGRWVRFPEHVSTETLLAQVRASPLLLCCVLLIAVRHSTQELADELAPPLFREAKRLVSRDLLVVPQSMQHFQAILILSLWSTTIGRQPLSMDGWLLTGYAIQQGFASSLFPDLSKLTSEDVSKSDVDASCLWNHLCVAHLHYCVGTRRPAMLTQEHVARCLHVLETGILQNYEARMVAEVKLYWVMYTKCSAQDCRVNLQIAKVGLQDWKNEHENLLNEPRSQFLQMSFSFAHLLAYCQAAQSLQSSPNTCFVLEMIELSRDIINLAMDTADGRTRHLTDHIYHLIVFSALTLCRLVRTYENQLRTTKVDVDRIDEILIKLIAWLRNVGLPCHVAHLLGDVVSFQFQKLRPNRLPDTTANLPHYTQALPNIEFYPDFIGHELFGMNDDMTGWP
ncbi:hypothetical protein MY4824_005044 [Beauveria thailandica]